MFISYHCFFVGANSNGYTCACSAGFSGVRCQTDVNECSSQPCANGGSCVDQVNGWTCRCAPGFAGINWYVAFAVYGCSVLCTQTAGVCGCVCVWWCSQSDLDECVSNPCVSGGVCSDRVNGYVCLCPPGTRPPLALHHAFLLCDSPSAFFDVAHCCAGLSGANWYCMPPLVTPMRCCSLIPACV